ncbi:LysR substrate-binding domain-containing protein [Crenobacter sp. SG2305]|uniref:LysR substrate-binding domain-containing protein n=1 Tax=Crenobacter oryzisoli TaxID=3056844 RepID=UPI0025AAAF21|nr:LysR substrate-binding domain-containing protein [Crenobacter sp. SG2305]MDN0082605.1 LysR substrate-binding domain-containing protein [Crenobacter sp. SG2305]
MVRLPPLNNLRVFEAAARYQSFVKAAAELHVTHGAVSRQIAQLEEQLGVMLFERRNRAVFLTREGLQLQEACAPALASLAEAVERLRHPPADAPLVVSCEPTIAMRWLIPRLGRFQQRHPAIPIHLFAASGALDFATSRVDLALRRDDFPCDATLYSAPLGYEWVGPVCSATLAERLAKGNAPMRLHTQSRPDAWTHWQQLSAQHLACGGEQRFEHFYLCLQAAGAGLGLAIGSLYMAVDELADGRLVAPFGFVPDGSRYLLLSPSPIDADPRRVALRDWLIEEFDASAVALQAGACDNA